MTQYLPIPAMARNATMQLKVVATMVTKAVAENGQYKGSAVSVYNTAHLGIGADQDRSL